VGVLEDEDALVGALTGAWTMVPELPVDELELELQPVVVEVDVDWVAAVVPGRVAAPTAPKIPTLTTPPAAAHAVSRRRPRRRLSRASAGSLGRCHVCMAPDCRPRLKQL
jgi:hypothetical protein